MDERGLTELGALARRTAARVLGNDSEADDIAQEAVARAIAQSSRIESYARPWTVRVATNLAIARLRQRARVEVGKSAVVSLAPATDPGTRIDLRRAIEGLPVRQRQVVVLRHIADLSEREVAERLGCSAGSVKRHLHRAMHTLRASLATHPPLTETEPEEETMVIPSWRDRAYLAATEPATGWPPRPWDHWFIQGPDGGWDRLAVDADGNAILDADGDEVMSGPGFDHLVVKVVPGRRDAEMAPDPQPPLDGFDTLATALVVGAIDDAAVHGHPWVGDEHLMMALLRHTDLAASVTTLADFDSATAAFYEGPWRDARLAVVHDRRAGAHFVRQPAASFSWTHALRVTLDAARAAATEGAATAADLLSALFAKEHCLPRILLDRAV